MENDFKQIEVEPQILIIIETLSSVQLEEIIVKLLSLPKEKKMNLKNFLNGTQANSEELIINLNSEKDCRIKKLEEEKEFNSKKLNGYENQIQGNGKKSINYLFS